MTEFEHKKPRFSADGETMYSTELVRSPENIQNQRLARTALNNGLPDGLYQATVGQQSALEDFMQQHKI